MCVFSHYFNLYLSLKLAPKSNSQKHMRNSEINEKKYLIFSTVALPQTNNKLATVIPHIKFKKEQKICSRKNIL